MTPQVTSDCKAQTVHIQLKWRLGEAPSVTLPYGRYAPLGAVEGIGHSKAQSRGERCMQEAGQGPRQAAKRKKEGGKRLPCGSAIY